MKRFEPCGFQSNTEGGCIGCVESPSGDFVRLADALSAATLRTTKRALLIQMLRMEARYERQRQQRPGLPDNISMAADRLAINQCIAAIQELRQLDTASPACAHAATSVEG